MKVLKNPFAGNNIQEAAGSHSIGSKQRKKGLDLAALNNVLPMFKGNVSPFLGQASGLRGQFAQLYATMGDAEVANCCAPGKMNASNLRRTEESASTYLFHRINAGRAFSLFGDGQPLEVIAAAAEIARAFQSAGHPVRIYSFTPAGWQGIYAETGEPHTKKIPKEGAEDDGKPAAVEFAQEGQRFEPNPEYLTTELLGKKGGADWSDVMTVLNMIDNYKFPETGGAQGKAIFIMDGFLPLVYDNIWSSPKSPEAAKATTLLKNMKQRMQSADTHKHVIFLDRPARLPGDVTDVVEPCELPMPSREMVSALTFGQIADWVQAEQPKDGKAAAERALEAVKPKELAEWKEVLGCQFPDVVIQARVARGLDLKTFKAILGDESFDNLVTRLEGLTLQNAKDFLNEEISRARWDKPERSPIDVRRLTKAIGTGSTASLQKYTVDLTQQALDGRLDPVIGRDEEVQKVMETLAKKKKPNACLVGDAGVGKTAVVEGLAHRIAKGDVPENLKGVQIRALDLGALTAGTRLRGEFETRLKGVLNEVAASHGKIILFVDEMHTLIGAGAAEGGSDAANLLKPALARGDIRCIGATTFDEYKKYVEGDAALQRRFVPVAVDEPSVADTHKILEGLRGTYEAHHQVQIADDALEAAARLADRYVKSGQNPDKAIDLLDTTCARKQGGKVTALDIAESIERQTGIKVAQVSGADAAQLLGLEGEINKKVIAQPRAAKAVANAIIRNRAGVGDPNKPLGSFLFLGPTGVGKTETANVLNEVLGEGAQMLRLDMSEYMERHSVSKLIGAPPGYAGYQNGGILTDFLRRNPHGVVLLDEVEKAHPDVLNLLLQLLDNGELTDSKGKKADGRNAVVIMTSNIGAQAILAAPTDRVPDVAMAAAKDYFRPELLNRLDNVVAYDRLAPEALTQIVELQVAIEQAKLGTQGKVLEFTPRAKALLAKRGYDEEYGARPLKRLIMDEPMTDVAKLILTRPEDAKHIRVDAAGESFTVRPA